MVVAMLSPRQDSLASVTRLLWRPPHRWRHCSYRSLPLPLLFSPRPLGLAAAVAARQSPSLSPFVLPLRGGAADAAAVAACTATVSTASVDGAATTTACVAAVTAAASPGAAAAIAAAVTGVAVAAAAAAAAAAAQLRDGAQSRRQLPTRIGLALVGRAVRTWVRVAPRRPRLRRRFVGVAGLPHGFGVATRGW